MSKRAFGNLHNSAVCTATLQGGHYCPHFTTEGTKAQRPGLGFDAMQARPRLGPESPATSPLS